MKVRALTAAVLATALVAGLGSATFAHGVAHRATHRTTHKTAHKRAKKPAASPFLKVLKAKKTVVLTVIAGDGTTNGGLDFDNTANGKMVVTVPVNWTVDVVFKNVGGLPHSVLFDTWKTSLSNTDPTAAFKGAQSPSPIAGTPPGGHANFRFKAVTVGKYRMICAFPGHAISGMWDTFVVSKTAKTATIKG